MEQRLPRNSFLVKFLAGKCQFCQCFALSELQGGLFFEMVEMIFLQFWILCSSTSEMSNFSLRALSKVHFFQGFVFILLALMAESFSACLR